MTDIRNHVPDYYDNVAEMVELIDAEDIVLDGFNARVGRTFLNMYVMQADIEGIEVLESMYHIVYDVLPELSTRRYNIIMRTLPPRPITLRYFRALLKSIEITADIDVDAITSNYVMNLDSDYLKPGQLDQALNLMRIYLPAHLATKVYNLYKRETTATNFLGVANQLSVEDSSDCKDDIFSFETTTQSYIGIANKLKVMAVSVCRDELQGDD